MANFLEVLAVSLMSFQFFLVLNFVELVSMAVMINITNSWVAVLLAQLQL